MLKEFIVWLKQPKVIMRLLFCLVLSAGFMGGCSYLNQKFGMADDNIIEEAVENKIQDATGLNIDLSPESPE